jgi:glutathione peroxidase-family protein
VKICENSGVFLFLGFPCNQFGGQEPGTPEEISKFLVQYRISFPIMNKVRMVVDTVPVIKKEL